MKIDIYAASSVGLIRNNNEDNFFVNGYYREDYSVNDFSYSIQENTGNLEVYAVFDGMGGAQFGEEASGAAAEALSKYYKAIIEEKMSFNSEMAIRKINNGVCKRFRNISNNSGSTIVMAVIHNNKMQVVNVGDSRAYLFREKALKQISIDHNEAEMYKQMQVEYDVHNSKNVLTQHLGIEENDFILEPFISDFMSIQKDDIILMCSDGLCGFVDDEIVEKILNKNDSMKNKGEQLIKEALNAGGNDNITVLLAGVV